jgi:hypothetical protein
VLVTAVVVVAGDVGPLPVSLVTPANAAPIASTPDDLIRSLRFMWIFPSCGYFVLMKCTERIIWLLYIL